MSEPEIQKRMKLGLVVPGASNAAQNEQMEEVDEWEDFEDADDGGAIIEKEEKEEYVIDKGRRSSVDLSSLSENIHDGNDWESESCTGSLSEFQSNKRLCSKEPGVTPINEEEEEIETLNGDDEVMELRDVLAS